jgi:hypothetical protein
MFHTFPRIGTAPHTHNPKKLLSSPCSTNNDTSHSHSFIIHRPLQRPGCDPGLSHQYPRNTSIPITMYSNGTSCQRYTLTLQTLVFFLALGYVLRMGTPDAPFGPPPIRYLLWIRGCLLSMGLITGYSSLRYLTISEFLTIFCCLPFPTGLLCWMFLGEQFTRVQMICCCKYPHYISRYLLIFRHLHARSSNDY